MSAEIPNEEELERLGQQIVSSTPRWWTTTQQTARQERIVFIKTHKTGSSTVTAILHRYCKVYNKTCFLPSHHPGKTEGPGSSIGNLLLFNYKSIDIWPQHTYYWRTFLNYMVPNAKYITIIRHPVTAFISAWNFYQYSYQGEKDLQVIVDSLPAGVENLPDDFLPYVSRNIVIELCPVIYERWRHIPDDSSCRQTLDDISTGMLQVLILERFDESLLLMMREFGWQLEDILYVPMKITGHSVHQLSTLQMRKISSWLMDPLVLYQHSLKVLEHRINSQDDQFQEQLATYRQLLNQYEQDCQNPSPEQQFLCSEMKLDNVPWVERERNSLLGEFVEVFEEDVLRRRRRHRRKRLQKAIGGDSVVTGKADNS